MEILVTTDGSVASLAALDAASQFAGTVGATMTLVRVLDPLLDCGDAFAATLAEAVATTQARWTADLEAALRQAGIAGNVLVVVKERNERQEEAILRAAKEQGAALIAMATRGRGRFRRALLGSVSMAVLNHANLPIMVTGPRFVVGEDREGYRVVITTDGSPGSLAVMQSIAKQLAIPGIQLTLLRICWPGDIDAEDEAQLREVAKALPPGNDVAVVVREMALVDGAAHGILEVSRELGASAIAMATEGHKGAYHVFSGSVALSVVSRSELPVILART